LRAFDVALRLRLERRLPTECVLGFAAGPPPDWRAELARILENLESATPADVVKVALLIPDDKLTEVRVFLAGIAAALNHRPVRSDAHPVKSQVPADETLSMEQAIDHLRVSRKTLRRLVKDGRLHPGRPTRKSWVFSRPELDRFLKATRRP
jgi:excisionase family DNA binding protein